MPLSRWKLDSKIATPSVVQDDPYYRYLHGYPFLYHYFLIFFLLTFASPYSAILCDYRLFYLGQNLVPLASDLEGACNVSPPFVTISTKSRSLQSRYLIDLYLSF